MVQKLNGSVISSSAVYTVSEDQETMTEVGGTPGDPPATMVWERQAPRPQPPRRSAQPGRIQLLEYTRI